MYLEPGEEIAAFCYILKQGDEKNKAALTNKHLIIKKKGNLHYFPIEKILSIKVQERKLLLPLLIGGILVPFCLLIIFRGGYHSWVVLVLLFSGIFSLYLGYVGQQAITVQTSLKEYDIFISDITPNFRAFISFVDNHIRSFQNQEKYKNHIKIIVALQSWEEMQNNTEIVLPELQNDGFIEAFSLKMEPILREQLSSLKNPAMVITLNPLKVKAEIKYEASESHAGRIVPRIYGTINQDAIEHVEVSNVI